MNRIIHFMAAFLVCMCVLLGNAFVLRAPVYAQAADKVAVLSTLNWAPYTSETLSGNGATSYVIREAFAVAGLDLKLQFFPWNRSIKQAWNGIDGAIGYFPGYHCKHNPNTRFVASKSVGIAPLGFAYRRDSEPLRWDELEDLRGNRIGYVTGYASTEKFETLEKNGTLKVLRTKDDLSNLIKLHRNQVDIALIDEMTFRYILRTSEQFTGQRGTLVFSPQYLKTNELHVCFRDDEKGRSARDVFNTALDSLDTKKLVDDYFAAALK